MELVKWSAKKSFSGPGYMLRMDREEALLTIRSLTEQIINNNPNTLRYETRLDTGEYFSISVEVVSEEHCKSCRALIGPHQEWCTSEMREIRKEFEEKHHG